MDKSTQAPQTGDCTQDGYTSVQGRNGTADGATASESGVSWLDSAALAECRRLTAECAALTERNAELRAALDEQGDELAALRREAASVPTELGSGRLLIVADSIASDADGLRTIEAYGRFFEREDGGRDGWMKLPVDADGVPIRVGDWLVGVKRWSGERFQVGRIEFDGEQWEAVDAETCDAIDAMDTRHVKPRTLEDVLADVARGILSEREGADEIRELMEVDE